MNTAVGGNRLEEFVFQRMTLTCEDEDDDGFLDFATCFSWRTSGNNELCDDVTDLYPGTKSKCFCERVNIDVPVPPADIAVVKLADPTSINEPGGIVKFTVEISNNVIDTGNILTITELWDSIYGNITISKPDNIKIESTTCGNAIGYEITGGGGKYTCKFEAYVEGNADDVITNTVEATGVDSRGNEVDGSDDATVNIIDVVPAITVEKTANPTSVVEPGSDVEFTVKVTNDSTADILILTSLVDDIYGDLNGMGDCSVPTFEPFTTIPIGGSYTCTFTEFVGGQPGLITNIVTATGRDDEDNSVSDTDSATVTITDVPATIEMIKTADPTSINEPGANVTYTFTVNNLSIIDTVTINSLNDSIYGDLTDQNTLPSTTCTVPQELAISGSTGDSYTCQITVYVEGEPGNVLNVATAVGVDDDGIPVNASDDATVNIQNVLPAATLTKTVKGMLVRYEVTVGNDSTAEALTVTELVDNIYGDVTLDKESTPNNVLIESTDCSVPQILAPKGSSGDTYTCTFWAYTDRFTYGRYRHRHGHRQRGRIDLSFRLCRGDLR